MRSLTIEEILQVMTEPKNALIRQYKAMFSMDGVTLDFTDDALREIAGMAMERETGVRSLRAMFEELLLDLRFTLASRKGERIVITKEFVKERLTRRGRDDSDQKQQKSA
jgi:ATP-dependent Clp protease ATP-binding subunit ClpX